MSNWRPRLELHFGEQKPAYRSNRVLTGWVLLDCHGRAYLQASKFYVECIGFWEAVELCSTGGHRRHRGKHLLMRRDLLPANQVLDSRRYDFRFRLDANLPHSIECEEVGFVRYCCRVVLDDLASTCTWNLEAINYFSLIEEVDLNSEAVRGVCRPTDQVSATVCKQLNSSNKSNNVKASLVLSKSAYVPGESVQCAITLTSATVRIIPVEGAVIQLVQTVTALGEFGQNFSGARGASRSTTIAENSVQADEQYSQHCWMTRCQLHIPGTVATSLLHVRSTQHPLAISYEVEMHISLDSNGINVKVRCPVVIGTLPLLEASGSKQPHPAAMQSAVVEFSRLVIAEGDHFVGKDVHSHYQQSQSRSQLSHSARRNSSSRSTAQISYTLYCIYYPMLSMIRQQKTTGLKSILKRHSAENSTDSSAGAAQDEGNDEDQLEPLQDARFKTSSSWYETPL